MMNFLEYSVCINPNLNPVWSVVGVIIDVIWIGVPILLIIFGSIDLGKAVIASKEDEIKKATKTLGKRFLAAVAVFAVVWVVIVVLDLASNMDLTQDPSAGSTDTSGWQACWCKISKGADDHIYYNGKCMTKKEYCGLMPSDDLCK